MRRYWEATSSKQKRAELLHMVDWHTRWADACVMNCRVRESPMTRHSNLAEPVHGHRGNTDVTSSAVQGMTVMRDMHVPLTTT